MSGRLVNHDYVREYLTHDAHWSQGHGGEPDSLFLGFGMMYYALVYMNKYKMVVCLGSGGGFVPRVLRQAQRDLETIGHLKNGRTILVDGDMGNWGRPNWTSPKSFFRTKFSDVEWWKMSTEAAAQEFSDKGIVLDYVHVDADHAEAHKDFQMYKSLVRSGGTITIHDTITGGGCTAGLAVDIARRDKEWDVIHWPLWAGIAVCRKV